MHRWRWNILIRTTCIFRSIFIIMPLILLSVKFWSAGIHDVWASSKSILLVRSSQLRCNFLCWNLRLLRFNGLREKLLIISFRCRINVVFQVSFVFFSVINAFRTRNGLWIIQNIYIFIIFNSNLTLTVIFAALLTLYFIFLAFFLIWLRVFVFLVFFILMWILSIKLLSRLRN